MSFFTELKRRNVFKVGAAYLVVSWLIAQIISVVNEPLHLPEWFDTVVILILLIGFPIVLLITWAFELTPEGIKQSSVVNPDESITSETGSSLNKIIISALVLVILVMFADNYLLTDSPESTTPTIAEEANNSSAPEGTAENENLIDEYSIAVMAFRDLSPGADQGWLADGIATEINTLLTRVEDLSVINTSSSFMLRGQDEDLDTIRELLGVNYIITGDLQRIDDDLRLSVRLSNTINGSQQWADTYEGKIESVFDVQRNIASSVSQALQISLGTGFFGSLPGMTRNVEAYEEYLKGIQYRRDGETVENTRESLSHMERALILDPDYTMPSMEIFDMYESLIPYIAPPDTFPERERRIEQAIAHVESVTPDSPLLNALQALGNSTVQDYALNEEATLEAINGLQGYGVTQNEFYISLANLQMSVGRASEAISILERIWASDPLNAGTAAWMSEALAMTGQIDRAEAILEEALTFPGQQNNQRLLGNLLYMTMFRMNPELLPGYSRPIPADNLTDINNFAIENYNNPGEVLERISELSEQNGMSSQTYNLLGGWAAFFGDKELALELMHKVIRDQGMTTNMLLFRPIYAEVRQMGGFNAIMEELGLADYWRTTGNWGDFCHPIEGSDTDFECF